MALSTASAGGYVWLARDVTTALSGALLSAFSAVLEIKATDKFTPFYWHPVYQDGSYSDVRESYL